MRHHSDYGEGLSINCLKLWPPTTQKTDPKHRCKRRSCFRHSNQKIQREMCRFFFQMSDSLFYRGRQNICGVDPRTPAKHENSDAKIIGWSTFRWVLLERNRKEQGEDKWSSTRHNICGWVEELVSQLKASGCDAGGRQPIYCFEIFRFFDPGRDRILLGLRSEEGPNTCPW